MAEGLPCFRLTFLPTPWASLRGECGRMIESPGRPLRLPTHHLSPAASPAGTQRSRQRLSRLAKRLGVRRWTRRGPPLRQRTRERRHSTRKRRRTATQSLFRRSTRRSRAPRNSLLPPPSSRCAFGEWVRRGWGVGSKPSSVTARPPRLVDVPGGGLVGMPGARSLAVCVVLHNRRRRTGVLLDRAC